GGGRANDGSDFFPAGGSSARGVGAGTGAGTAGVGQAIGSPVKMSDSIGTARYSSVGGCGRTATGMGSGATGGGGGATGGGGTTITGGGVSGAVTGAEGVGVGGGRGAGGAATGPATTGGVVVPSTRTRMTVRPALIVSPCFSATRSTFS